MTDSYIIMFMNHNMAYLDLAYVNSATGLITYGLLYVVSTYTLCLPNTLNHN